MKTSLLAKGLFLLFLLVVPIISDSFGLSVTDSGSTSSLSSTTSLANTTVNATVSSNVTSTSGTVSTSGNPINATSPSNQITTNASTSINGVQVFGNGTIITSVNGTQMSFYFDPKGPAGASTTLTIQSADLSGNLFSGMYVALYSGSKIINHGYTPVTFQVSPGTQYMICASNYQKIVFDHWDDGSKNACRSFTLTQSSVFTAYYSTGSAPPTVPSSPTNLSATASSSQIDLSWTAPSNNGGSSIIGYEIDRSLDSGSTWSILVSNTGTTITSYSDTSVVAGITYTYRVLAINAVGTSSPSNTASATTPIASNPPPQSSSITLVQSGNVGYDPLNNQTQTQQQLQTNQKYWKYDGSAVAEGAPYTFNEDIQGLHIGVQAASSGKWAGFFAVTPNTQAALFHAIVSQPIRTIPNNNYENGLYVQTSNGKINYVTCVALTNNQATVWAIVNTYGTTTQATQFNVLWMDNSPNQSLTRDCTIITNGSNYLKVYLDNTLVYTSNSLNLQMPAPYNAYLEPETSYSGQLLSGTYTYYYAAAGENIKVINNPTNAAMVKIVDATGQVLASSPVNSGTAILDVGKYDFPLTATISVYDSSNNVIASGQAKIFGGDVYSVN